MFRLDTAKILEVAALHGDKTRAAIYRRTGITESSVYRILNGETQPDLNSAMRLAEAYDLDIREVMERIEIAAVPA